MPATRTCPQCGAPLPAEGWAGLCPKCLVRVSLEPLGTSLAAAQSAEDESKEAVSAAGSPERTIVMRESDVLTERTGMMIGRYKLLEQIGEGGCGVVYVAE